MDVKELIKGSGVCQWEVAERLNMSEFTLSRWLRRPEKLDKGTVNQIERAVTQIRKEKGRKVKGA